MSSGLQATILALRAALHDQGAGNDQVRDCAFEVVAAYDRAIAATTTRCAHCNHAAAELINGWLYGPMCLRCAEVAFHDIASALTAAHVEQEARRMRERAALLDEEPPA